MKNLLTLSLMLGLVTASFAQITDAPEVVTDGAKIKFQTEAHDFGTIQQGEAVNYIFKFENIGTEPLVITSATSTCGCTVPSWPKEPIQPGEFGKLEVEFNSANKLGKIYKKISVVTNSVDFSTHTVAMKGTVEITSIPEIKPLGK